MQTAYLTISVVVGLIVVIDGITLLIRKGESSGSTLLKVTTNIELLWAAVSIFSLVAVKFGEWFYAVPIIYVGHNVSGWMYGSALTKKLVASGKTPESLIIPNWYIWFGLFIGIVFTCLSGVAVWQIYS